MCVVHVDVLDAIGSTTRRVSNMEYVVQLVWFAVMITFICLGWFIPAMVMMGLDLLWHRLRMSMVRDAFKKAGWR